MAEIFKFFNSAPGDERWHYASDFADYFGSVLSSGLISNGEAVGLQVTVNTGTMTTSVNVGKAIIKGYSYENTTPVTLTHSIPEQTLDRIDRVVLRLDLKNASRFIKVFVKEGVSALEPVPPTLQRDQYIYELSLAQVRIRKNTSSIVVSDIKDERADENLCGIVQSLITVPTSVFQQQFDAWFASIADVTEQSVTDWQIAQQQAFTAWFDSIKGQLDGDVGAKLASDLTTHQADLAHVHWIGTATGTNTLTATYEAITALKNGLGVAFLNTTSSTGATTLNINGLGAIPILKANGNPVTNLKMSGIYTLRYANGNFILQGEGGEYGTATASDVLAGKTIGTENGIIEGIATVASLGGKRWASGNAVSVYRDGYPTIDVKNLGFTPTLLYAQKKTEPENYSIVLAIKDSSSGFFGFNSFVVYKIPNGYYDALKPFYWVGLIPTTKFLTDGFSLATNNSNVNEYKNPHTYRWLAIE